MLNLLFSGKLTLILVVAIVVVLSIFAAEAANRSFFEERKKLMGWQGTIMYFAAGIILLIIHLLTKTWFGLYLLLQFAICYLQFKNQEGRKRSYSWNKYSWILIVLTIFSYAGYLDKGHIPSPVIIILGVIVSILPFVVGSTRSLYLDDPDYYDAWIEKFKESKIATVVLIIVAVLAVALMCVALKGILS